MYQHVPPHPNLLLLLADGLLGERAMMVLGMASSSVEALVRRTGALAERLVVDMVRQVLDAVAHLHAHDVVWCDAKYGNVLWGRYALWKAADFGVSARQPADPLTQPIGSVPYSAPEMVEEEGKEVAYGVPVDVWAIGCLAAFAATGVHLFALEPGTPTHPVSRTACRVQWRTYPLQASYIRLTAAYRHSCSGRQGS